MSLCLLPLLLPFLAPTPVEGDPEAERIARVEAGLYAGPAFRGEPGHTIAERMQHYGVPGLSLAVIHDGRVAWAKTYGVADRESGAPVDADTLFQAGSVSKPVAAMGALALVAKGALVLDEDVNAKLESWQLPENEFTRERSVTLSHLLTHTGGLTVHGFPGYAVGAPVPTLVQVLDGTAPANTDPIRVDTVPGTLWRYSGGGYTIAQQLMIDVAGRPFPELMHELVLEPLGMQRSTYEQPLPPERLAHAAAGILPDGSAVGGKRHTYPEMAAAGLWTTAEELAQVAIEVQSALRGEGAVLPKEMAELMLRPTLPAGPHYGHGFALEMRGEGPYFSHGGWDEGFCAQLTAHRTGGYGVVAMINSNHPAFLDELVRAVALEYGWGGYDMYEVQPVPEHSLATAPGRYRYNAEQAIAVTREGERLFMQYAGQAPEELVHVGDGRFLRRERETPIVFSEDDGRTFFHFDLGGGRRQTHAPLEDDERTPRELLYGGPYDEALAAYRAVQHETPGEPAISEGYLNGTGLELLDRGRTDEAILLLRVATDLYPSSANTWDSLGYAYRAKGDREQAIRYYEKALEVDASFPTAVAALAELRQE